jgi:Fe2+ or Zn2+ uptake regulation protein
MVPKIKNTTQRIKIVEFLKSVKTHPTAEDVYGNVKKELPGISLGTVYRNLNLLADLEMIQKLEINNEFHFDGDVQVHQHGVCDSCNKIFDIFQKNISDFALSKVKTNEFIPKGVTVIFNGLCRNCSG